MMYFHKKPRLFTSLFIAIVYTLLAIPSSVLAQEVECTEDMLRSLGVTMISCSGNSNQCSEGGGVITQRASSNIPEPHKSVIERAASEHSVNPNLIAALFLTEQGNIWKPFEGPYATSSAGASGPFQFMPGTWSGYGSDGNGDGVIDIQNFEDAAFAAAKMAASATNQSTPLGDLSKPFVPDTLVYFSATYNWGPGNVQRKTNPDSPISVAPTETENYMKNIHALISSDFIRGGHPSYGQPRLPGDEATSSDSGGSSDLCVSSGSVAGLVTDDADQARNIILSSPNMRWGNFGPATTQKQDIENCLTDQALFSIATIAEKSGVVVPVNALATDHGGCDGGKSHHNQGRAIDIGYYGSNSEGQDRHVAEGDTLYKFLFDNRVVLKVDELIWQYPPTGYKCTNNGVVGECSELYSAAVMNQHYHHIHVSFKQ